ncbi:hypothetical protein K4F52_002899 [Lecanicillium sp. MT-2017a]|nr:hypothetical protein K4F52_002899 [Lecanicillium sp. MT-2017a]
MKASIVLGCLAATTLAAQPIVERDLKTITGVLDEIKTDIQTLDDAVKNYSDDKEPLLKASNDLIESIKSGKTKVDGSDNLELNDAVSLTGPVQELTSLGQTLADDLKARRETVEKLGECSLVRTQISSVNEASQALIKSVISKVPEEAQSIAEQLAAGLTDVLNQSQEDFSEANCKDSGSPGGGDGGDGGSSAPGGGSTSAPPSESTPAPAPTTSAAAPGGGATHPTGGNGSPTKTDSPPVVTGGAATMAPLGGLAIAVAALLA